MWGYGISGPRYNPYERTITPQNVGRLQLKWAFVFPGADAASSQPAVVGNRLYVGGRDGYFYALNARTGQQIWRFDTSAVTGSQHPTVGVQGGAGAIPYFGNSAATTLLRDGPAVVNGTVYFGDNKANLYALDASSGELKWHVKLDSFADAIITSSPVVDGGRLFVGVSSGEEAYALLPSYECCQFRGSVVALDTATGRILWRHYTQGLPRQDGVNDYGTPYLTPSGAAVWATPALDAADHLVLVGVGNPYSGPGSGESDSMIALNEQTGSLRWSVQLTHSDEWNLDCEFHTTGDCPSPGPDFDFAAGPNVFRLRIPLGMRRVRDRDDRGRARGFDSDDRRRERYRTITVVGEGQKSGVYHLLYARTGRIIWQTELSRPVDAGGPNFQQGIQWGTSYDGKRIYVATAVAHPSTISALNPRTGRILWQTRSPADGCSTGGSAQYGTSGGCEIGMAAAVSTIPGVVFEGSLDGKLRAFAAATGKILWSYDTVRSYTGSNGQDGNGGSISGAGATISHGMVYVNSGYNTEESPDTGIHGNVLLAFGLPGGQAADNATRRALGPASGPRAALARCISAWNAETNQPDRELARPRRVHRRLVHARANMMAQGASCLITIKLGLAPYFQLSLYGTHYKPVGEANIPPPPERRWNLRISSHGTIVKRRVQR